MTVASKRGRREIDIDGPDGNAHYLIGTAILWAKQGGLDHKKIVEEMTSGDYINLLKVFDRHFGEMVTLVTENEAYLKAFETE